MQMKELGGTVSGENLETGMAEVVPVYKRRRVEFCFSSFQSCNCTTRKSKLRVMDEDFAVITKNAFLQFTRRGFGGIQIVTIW